jgi:hypothetical protein
MADDNIVIVEEVLSLTVQTAVGATGPTGPTGPSGVIAVTAPITNSGTSTSANIGIDQTGITIAQSQVTSLVSDLALKAPLASPTFTGTPTLPTGTIATTQTAGNSTTAVATTAFVTTANQLFGTYTAFTPTLTNITIGNGTVTSQYCRVNNFVHYFGTITLGSTSAVTGAWFHNLPITADSAFAEPMPMGVVYAFDVSTFYRFLGIPFLLSTTSVYSAFSSTDVSGQPRFRQSNATQPFTWAVGDKYSWNFYYKAA